MIEAMKQALEALELALRSHGVMLLSDPPQDAWKTYGVDGNARQAITSLRQAIAELESQEPVAWISPSGALYRTRYHAVANAEQLLTPLFTHPPQRTEQEPIAWMSPSWIDPNTRGWQSDSFESIPIEGWLPIYTTPPQSTWVGLTDEEVKDIVWNLPYEPSQEHIRAIEAALKERNT